MNVKNNFITKIALAIFTLSSFAVVGTALAATPVLSISQSGNFVTLGISNANANSPVYLYQRQTAPNFTTSGSSLGNTDSNGNFSTTQTVSFDGSSNPVLFYVLIGGAQSPTVQIPPGTCSSNCVGGTLNLSQTSVSVNSGQSLTVLAYPSSGTVSISSNSNSSVATAFVSGTSIIITGNVTGSTTIVVCSTSTTSQCGSILVTVNGGSSTTLNFSNASPVVTAGQSSNITIYSPSNSNSASYYVSNNSNSNVVTNPSVSGSTLYFSGGVPGNASLIICQTGASYCGTVAVTVGSNGQGGLTVNPNTLTLTVGNTGTATISNTTGTLSITNNSNSSVISASVSNTTGATTQTITVYANAAGTSTLTVCPVGSTSGCVFLYVQVGSTGSNGNSTGVSFSVPNPVMTVGQSQSIAIYSTNGVNTYTISNNSSASIVSLSLSGSSLYLVGQNVGSSTITVCQSASTICGTLYVTVNGSGGGLTFNPSNVNVAQNQSQTVAVTGGDGNYFISSNTNPSTAAVSLQSGSIYVTGLNSGNSSVTVCQSTNSSVCGVISVTVGGASGNSGAITFSNNAPTLGIGQTLSITLTGGSGSYYISSISNPSALTLNLSGSQLNLTGVALGSSSISICQTGGSTCATLAVNINTTGTTTTGPVTFTSTILPAAVSGQAYSYQLKAQGGSDNYTYSVTSGGLPAGLSMLSGGLIQGTPSITGTSNFTLQVADSGGTNQSLNFSITVGTTAPTTVTPTGQLTNGELINEKGTISIIYNNTKTPFANAAAFLGLGYSFANVVPVTNSGLPLSGKIVVTANGGHPRGSWLISGATVYFLTPGGIIPVPSWSIFLSNGGQASFLVKANSYDLGLTKLPLMVSGDSRLH
jgi:large repetitive protein